MEVLLAYRDTGAASGMLRALEAGVYVQVLADASIPADGLYIPRATPATHGATLVLAHKARLVCFYADEFNGTATLDLVTALGRANPETLIAVAGPLSVIDPDRIMANPAVKYLVAGEGEIALYELVHSLFHGGSELSQVRNLWHRTPAGIARNTLRPLQEKLDLLPYPHRGILDACLRNKSWHGGLPAVFAPSRGCPFECAFCYSPILKHAYEGKGAYYRFRSPQHLLAEIRGELKRQKADRLLFLDEIFPTDRKWLAEFAAGMTGMPRFEAVIAIERMDSETLPLLKTAGCTRVVLGLETGEERTRKRVAARNLDSSALHAAVRAAKKLGMEVATTCMTGLPGETEQTHRDTLGFLKETAITDIRAAIYVPISGTPLARASIEQGWDATPPAEPDFAAAFPGSAEVGKSAIATLQRLGLMRLAGILPRVPAPSVGHSLMHDLPRAKFSMSRPSSLELVPIPDDRGGEVWAMSIAANTEIRFPAPPDAIGARFFFRWQGPAGAQPPDAVFEIHGISGAQTERFYLRHFSDPSSDDAPLSDAVALLPVGFQPAEFSLRLAVTGTPPPQSSSFRLLIGQPVAVSVCHLMAIYGGAMMVLDAPPSPEASALTEELDSLRDQLAAAVRDKEQKTARAAELAEQVGVLESLVSQQSQRIMELEGGKPGKGGLGDRLRGVLKKD